MTTVHASQLVDSYLRRLETELADVPASRRAEIMDEIRGHIAEERRVIADESDADVMNLLDRLGDPADIAAEARDGLHGRSAVTSSSRLGTHEVLALALSILAWPAGIVLLWTSKAWTTREKLLGTLLPPGGYPGVLLIMSTFRWFVRMSDAGPRSVQVAVGALLFTVSLLLIVAPVGTCIYLVTRLRAASSPPGR